MRKSGSRHYREILKLKPILVYVSKKAHAKLLAMAKKKGSLQKLAREVLEEFSAKAHKI